MNFPFFSDPDYFFHGFYVSFIFGGVPSWVLLDICGIPLKRGTVMQVRPSMRSVVILSTRPIYVCWPWGGKSDRKGIWITRKKTPFLHILIWSNSDPLLMLLLNTWVIGKRNFSTLLFFAVFPTVGKLCQFPFKTGTFLQNPFKEVFKWQIVQSSVSWQHWYERKKWKIFF